MKKTLLNILKFSLFLAIGVAILWWFYNNQNTAFQAQLVLEGKQPYPLIDKLIQDFRSVNLFWVAMTLLAFSISNYSRAVRWNMLIKPLGHKPKDLNSFFAVNISYLANLFMSRAGEVVRAGSLARVEKMSATKIMGTVVVDRILDLFSLALIVAFGFLVEYETLWNYLDKNIGSGDGKFRLFQNPIFLGLVGFSAISIILFFIFRNKILQLPIIQRLMHILEKFTEGLKTIKKIDNLPLFIFHSVNIWVMYYLMTYLCFFAFAPTAHLAPLAALTVFVFGTFGIVIPSPGGMGTYHVLATAALVIHGVNSNDAFSFANIMFFSIQIFYNFVAGILSFILINTLNKKDMLAADSLSVLDPEVALD